MTTFVLVRHGETDWNKEEIYRGRADIPLNETGVNQARLLASYLSELEINAVYSSPLGRARQTAEEIAKYHGIGIEAAEGLNDLDFGQWQGLSHEVVRARFPELYADWFDKPHLVKMPGGESLADVRERALGLVNRIQDKYTGTVVLVTHRVVNKVLILALLGLDGSHFWSIRMDNCGATTFDFSRGTFILVSHNDTSFLKMPLKVQRSDF